MKITKLSLIKIKTFSQKSNIQATGEEKIVTNHISNKVFVPKIHKDIKNG